MSDQSINVLQRFCTREISRRNKGLLGKSKEEGLAQPWGCHTPDLSIVALQVDVRAFLFLERWTRFSASEEPRDLLHLRTLHHAWSVCHVVAADDLALLWGAEPQDKKLALFELLSDSFDLLSSSYSSQSLTLQLSSESITPTFAAPVPSPPSSRSRRSADHRKQRCRPAIYLIPKLGRIGRPRRHSRTTASPCYTSSSRARVVLRSHSQFISAIKNLPNWLSQLALDIGENKKTWTTTYQNGLQSLGYVGHHSRAWMNCFFVRARFTFLVPPRMRVPRQSRRLTDLHLRPQPWGTVFPRR